ncbi:unnamed protein product [Ilex paraguariensis]|uniref:AAA+ ATPase domain-containing protein n=1 Tax=Ilex paraguariensis TaxID=185542 RepID=A0ABC8SHR3_9AQUA
MKSPRRSKQRANTTPQKRRMNSTPKKKVMDSGLEEACSGPISINAVQSVHSSQLIPDLRLEAKMTAEENSRIFVGKQVHPFFSSWKMCKRNHEIADAKLCSIEKKNKRVTFSPIHVFEKVEDDVVSLDWENWIFSESGFVSNTCLGSGSSSIYERRVKFLQFDNFPSITHPGRTSLCQNEISLNHCCIQHEEVSLNHSLTERVLHVLSPTPADEQLAFCELPKNTEVNLEMGKVDLLSGKDDCVRKSHVEWQGKFLEERIMSHYHGSGNQPENSLWTDKYQPGKAFEVCGNGESVKFLSEWLHLWHERGFRTSKNSTGGKKRFEQDVDYSSYHSDCDSDNIDDETSLKNVLLVTGPVGSGKSAAIYACAREQGFQVIEVNASDWRNGSLVRQKFGEAVESCWLQRPANPENKHPLRSSKSALNTLADQGSGNEVIELIPLSDEEDSQNASRVPGKSVCKENKTSSDECNIKTLVLFEDVDATLYEDRGFIATIQQLAETAKRPMILTSNSDNPVLPDNLDRLEVCFTIPSLKELLGLVHLICAAEKAKVHPCLIERFIGYCHGDIRKTIMHLQFWCQGESFGKGKSHGQMVTNFFSENSELRRMYHPLLFDLDAGHQILPKIVPWSCPSRMSELLEEEITKSLFMMEESNSLTEIVEEDLDNDVPNTFSVHGNEPDTVGAKKVAMLSMHCSVQDGNDFAVQFDNTCEFSTSSGSPIAFTRRNARRKLDTVLSSDSGEECSCDGVPVVSGRPFDYTNSEVLLEVNNKSSSHCVASERHCNPLTEYLCHSEGKLERNIFQCSETSDNSHINAMCTVVDVSCVPESFVPETEVNNGTVLFSRTVSCSHVADKVEAASTSNDFMPNLFPSEGNNLCKSLPGFHKNRKILGNTSDIFVESFHGEEVGDSHVGCVEVSPKEYQAMDECSRINFGRSSKLMEKHSSGSVIDTVQETWRKFRDGHMDLKQYITPEQKNASQVLKQACGISNLISEADLLLNDCQPLICDYLETSVITSENSHSFGWHDDQLQMASTIAQHGICFYSKKIAALGSNMEYTSTVDLGWEMLTSSTSTMALGKLVSQDRRTIESLEMELPITTTSLKSDLESCFCNILQSIVPSKSHLSLRGDAFHEYLSSLGQISRSEASRLSESSDKMKRRRARVPRHYLSSGALMLSSEYISLLSQYNCYQKVSSQSTDASLR